MPSILLSVPMALTGSHTVATALSASLVAGALVPVPAAVLGYRLSGSHLLAAAAAVVVCLMPRLSYWSVQTESVPFFVLFALTAMAVAAGPGTGRLRWPAVGASAAAAYLCRSDGALLLLGLALPLAWPVLRHPRSADGRWRLLVGYVLGAAVVLTPWLVTNLIFLHRLVPPTSGLVFLQSYEQLFAVGSHPGLHDVLRHGLGTALRFRWHTLVKLWRQLENTVGHAWLWALGLLAALNLPRRRRPAALRDDGAPRAGLALLAAIAGADLLVQGLVIPVVGEGGTWARSLLAYVPVLVVAALLGARRLRVLPLAGAAGVVAAVITLGADTTVAHVVHRNNAAGDVVTAYAPFLGRGERPADVVVMTRDVWQLTEVTGERSVMIPSGSLCDVLGIAVRYHATDIVTAKQRPGLDAQTLTDHGFTLVGGSTLHKVYRFPAELPDCRHNSP